MITEGSIRMMARGQVEELDGFLADLREKSPNAAVLRQRIGECYAQCGVSMDYCRRDWITEWKRRFPLLRFCAILRTDTNYAEIYAKSGSAHVMMIDKLTAWRKNVSFPTYSWWEEDEPYRFSRNPDGTWCIEAYYWWEREPQIPREHGGKQKLSILDEPQGREEKYFCAANEEQREGRQVLMSREYAGEQGMSIPTETKGWETKELCEAKTPGASGTESITQKNNVVRESVVAGEKQQEGQQIRIPQEYLGTAVTAIADGAFEGNTEIRKIVLPETIRSVGHRAFADCPNLVVCVENTEIRQQLRSAGVMVVDVAADADLAQIRLHYTYEIENGEARILSYRGTEPYVVVPAEVEGCPVTEIGPEAFCRREAHKSALRIERLIVPDTIRKIGRKAFYDTGLKEFFLPAQLEEIGEYAFAYCQGPEALLLPDGLSSVEELRDFHLIKSVFVNEENPFFCARDGVLFSKDGSRLIWYPSGRINEEYEIGAGVTEIGNRAFEVNKRLRGEGYLRRVTMTDEVKSIGEKAFCNCGRLEEIRLSAALTTLGMSAFFNCIALREITVPEGVEEIPFGTFYMCRELERAYLPDGVRVIGDRAFYSCRSLPNLRLPRKLEKVGDYAFHDCQALEEFVLPEGVLSIGREACSQCQHMRRAALPTTLRKIGKNAFSWCRGLKALDVPAGVTKYQTWTEEDCVLRLRGIPMRAVTGKRYQRMAAIGYMQMEEEESRRGGGAVSGVQDPFDEQSGRTVNARGNSQNLESNACQRKTNMGAGQTGFFREPGSGESAQPKEMGELLLELIAEINDMPSTPDYSSLSGISGSVFEFQSDRMEEREASDRIKEAAGLFGGSKEWQGAPVGLHSDTSAMERIWSVRPEYRKGYEDYIRENCREFYELAFADGTVLHFLTRHEMISAEDADELLEQANREKNTQAAAEILEYKNKLSSQSESSPWDDILAGTGWF